MIYRDYRRQPGRRRVAHHQQRDELIAESGKSGVSFAIQRIYALRGLANERYRTEPKLNRVTSVGGNLPAIPREPWISISDR